MENIILFLLLIISLVLVQMSGVIIILVFYFVLTHILSYLSVINSILKLSVSPVFITKLYTVIGITLAVNLIDNLVIKKTVKIPKNKINLFIVLYSTIIVISLLFSPYKYSAQTSLFSIFQFLALYLVMIVLVKDEKFIEFMIKLNILTFSFLIVLFLLSLFHFKYSEQNYIIFGSAVGMLPILWVYRMISKNHILQLLLDILNVIILLMLFYSGHRRYLIIAIGTFFIFIIFEKGKFFKKFIFVILIGLIILPKQYIETRMAKRQYTFEDMIKTRGKKGMEGRYELWQDGVKLFQKSPIIGIGYRESQHVIGRLKQNKETPRRQMRIHNTYLATMVETGVIGLLFYLIILFHMIRNYYEARNLFIRCQNLKMSYFSLAYLSSAFAGLFVAFFGSSGPNDKIFWSQLAMSVIFLEVARKRTSPENIDPDKLLNDQNN